MHAVWKLAYKKVSELDTWTFQKRNCCQLRPFKDILLWKPAFTRFHHVIGTDGLEPPTRVLKCLCSTLLSYVPVCFSDQPLVIRISNNLFPRGICNPYAPLVPIARRFYQLYADLFINVCNIYSYPRSTQTVLRRYVINCLYGKVRMERIGYSQFVHDIL